MKGGAPMRLDPAFGQFASGDLFLMNRKCLAMKDPIGIGLCMLAKTENRFDHVAMLVRISDEKLKEYPEAIRHVTTQSPSGTYVLETNMKGVTLISAEDRVERSSSNEIAVRVLRVPPEELALVENRILDELEHMCNTPYQDNWVAFLPPMFSPPDKMDRVEAAQKVHKLQHEVDNLHVMAANHPPRRQVYERLASTYREAQLFLLDTYFPHLLRASADDPRSVDWSGRHYWVDGRNQSRKMVCSELVCNLWQRIGLTHGYVPASSMRPFDFLEDVRINFVHPRAALGSLVPVKVNERTVRNWSQEDFAFCRRTADIPSETYLTESQRLDFFNRARTSVGLAPVPSIEAIPNVDLRTELSGWLVQSNTQKDVARGLAGRVFGTGLLFSLCLLPCAPLTLRWIECQLGLFLVRGSVWSLTAGVLARNVCCVATQAACLSWFVRWCGISRGDVLSGESKSTLVDTRHPYYAVAVGVVISSSVAHVVSTPIMNATLAHHFGPTRPGPVPLLKLMKGAGGLLPLYILLPLQAYWVAWYETLGSLIVPTPSSVFRPRADLLEKPTWPHYRNDAMVGAFLATLLADLALYPFERRVRRSFLTSLYKPQRSPCFGTRAYSGYSYRLASNLIVYGLTSSILYSASVI